MILVPRIRLEGPSAFEVLVPMSHIKPGAWVSPGCLHRGLSHVFVKYTSDHKQQEHTIALSFNLVAGLVLFSPQTFSFLIGVK